MAKPPAKGPQWSLDDIRAVAGHVVNHVSQMVHVSYNLGRIQGYSSDRDLSFTLYRGEALLAALNLSERLLTAAFSQTHPWQRQQIVETMRRLQKACARVIASIEEQEVRDEAEDGVD